MITIFNVFINEVELHESRKVMKFVVLKKNNLKRNVVIGVFVVLIISAVILNFSSARYRSTASVPIVDSEVNYVRPDLNVVAMYQKEDGGEYVSIDTVPSTGYTLNEGESYCKVGDDLDSSIPMSYEDGKVYIGVVNKGTKCYLYFDEMIISPSEQTLINLGLTVNNDTPDFTVSSCNEGCGETTVGLFKTTANDDYGNVSYYFRGDVDNNYVSFAGFYWRIIRINGDGTIRLIYDGTNAHANGESSSDRMLSNSFYNSNYNRSEYVGFTYAGGLQRPTVESGEANSTIKTALETWYEENLFNYSNYIDQNGKFCNDRDMANGYEWESSPSASILYASTDRVSGTPKLQCNNYLDIYTMPIGLITIDEVLMAGGTKKNNDYYLYIGDNYWTMSPYGYNPGLNTMNIKIYCVSYYGALDINGAYKIDSQSNGIRPVINLKANTQFTGTGTINDPFVVV